MDLRVGLVPGDSHVSLPGGELLASFEGVEHFDLLDWPHVPAIARLAAASPYPLPELPAEVAQERAAAATPAKVAPGMSRDLVRDSVLQMLNDIADTEEPLGLDDELAEGIDSLGSTMVLSTLQLRFGINIPVSDWMDMVTVGDLVRRVLEDVPEDAGSAAPVQLAQADPPASLPAPAPAPVPAADGHQAIAKPRLGDVQETVMAVLNGVSDEESMELDTPLAETIDSLASSMVIQSINMKLGVNISVVEWVDMEKVSDLISFVAERLPDKVAQAAPAGVPQPQQRQPPAAPAGVPQPQQRQPPAARSRGQPASPMQAPSSRFRAAVPEVKGLELVRAGSGPAVFLLPAHSPEAEELAGTAQAKTERQMLASLLVPCEVCSVNYDEEAFACQSLAELAKLYTNRVLQHCHSWQGQHDEPLLVVGWSLSCVLAHALALRLRHSGVSDVRLLCFDRGSLQPLEVRDEEPAWFGAGEEAALLAARITGESAWAESEARRLKQRKGGAIAAEDEFEDMQMRLFWEQGAKPGRVKELGPVKFSALMRASARKAERLRLLSLQATTGLQQAACFDGRSCVAKQRSMASGAFRSIGRA
eukprot:TRINITY_DN7656_c0_g1_i1.p1 TRINITY_DN7656_c0_g1~~TRINITY_DN7656_c0_g1_i1.p1  ORF type:complete len:607 (+),score=129.88 TRINITY_DN7656_c0_g1_i1:50-1822(+)